MLISILLSGIIIAMCESNCLSLFRKFIKRNIIFFDGKKSVIENIFIGIFASSLIALIGYIFEYMDEEKRLKLEIISTFKGVYYKYYNLIGDTNIKDIIEKYIMDDVIIKANQCDIEYKKIFSKKADIYNEAIEIMRWVDLYYSNIYSKYSSLYLIEGFIDKIKKLWKK